jgi:hypothetical protein
MGQRQNVKCQCGYRRSVTIGGGMRNYQTDSRFPHYCKTCGLVDVNIQSTPLKCPDCHSPDVMQYGLPPISLPGDGRLSVQWGKYEAYRTGNLCPQCQQMTLEFTNTTMMFD